MSLMSALLVYASYWVRPYDMLADRRRWFWQARSRCFRFSPPHVHAWRRNVAWSHLMRCDGCGADRPITSEDVIDETIAYIKRGTAK